EQPPRGHRILVYHLSPINIHVVLTAVLVVSAEHPHNVALGIDRHLAVGVTVAWTVGQVGYTDIAIRAIPRDSRKSIGRSIIRCHPASIDPSVAGPHQGLLRHWIVRQCDPAIPAGYTGRVPFGPGNAAPAGYRWKRTAGSGEGNRATRQCSGCCRD